MKQILVFLVMVFFSGCAVVNEQVIVPQPQKQVIVPKKSKTSLKKKVAIARFTNESSYGKSAMFGLGEYDISKQTTDILSTMLAKSENFILLERLDLEKINKELKDFDVKSLKIPADYLIVGSVSEFGRKAISDVGIFSRKKTQIAYARVNIRIIDIKTNEIIFAQDGAGEARSEAGQSGGLGKGVSYDSTLNDKAVSSAMASMIDKMMENMLQSPWRSYILAVDSNTVTIAGGKAQGVKINDEFNVYKKGKTIKNPQTGMPIELPGTKVATIKILSQFGNSYSNEGSIANIISGSLKGLKNEELYIQK